MEYIPAAINMEYMGSPLSYTGLYGFCVYIYIYIDIHMDYKPQILSGMHIQVKMDVGQNGRPLMGPQMLVESSLVFTIQFFIRVPSIKSH